MKYNLTKKDFDRVFKFAIDYHLHPTKGFSSRTTGASRGLGGVLDSFVRGKLVELGVIKILEKQVSENKFVLDFEIKSTSEATKDPDIVGVVEKNIKRDPKIFVEIKNVGINDRWIGLTQEQYNTAVKYSKEQKIVIIGATIQNTQSNKNLKQKDFVGSYLRDKTKLDFFDEFANIESVSIEIDFAILGEDLVKHGLEMKKDGLMYETEVFSEAGPNDKKSVLNNNFKSLGTINNQDLEIYKTDKIYPAPKMFGNFSTKGKALLYEKNNEKSTRRFILCKTNLKVTNKYLGEFLLKKGEVYLFSPGTLGRNPVLGRNNIWIAKRNIPYLIKSKKIKDTSYVVKEIAKNI